MKHEPLEIKSKMAGFVADELANHIGTPGLAERLLAASDGELVQVNNPFAEIDKAEAKAADGASESLEVPVKR